MSRFLGLVAFGAIALSFYSSHAQACDSGKSSVRSPRASVQIDFCLKSGVPHYSVRAHGKKVLDWSALGFVIKDQPNLGGEMMVQSVQRRKLDRTWEQVWGEERFIREHYNEMKVSLLEKSGLKRRMNILFRAFEDGIGFRYEIPDQQGLKDFVILDEKTEFRFLNDHPAWWIPAYTESVYEHVFERNPISQMAPSVHTPLTIEAEGLYLSIHEANLTDYSSMQLKPAGPGVLVADLAPYADNVTKVKATSPMKTPWRTLQIAKTPGDLITSYLILNLNEPNRLADTSFVRPMKYIGIWWGMHIGNYTWGSGPRHGATTERAKQYIDAAVQLGTPGLLIEGWNIGWDSWGKDEPFDYVRSYPDFDLKEVTTYARERGVEIIGHHETAGFVKIYEAQIDAAFQLYKDNGVRAVKTGYVKWRPEGEYHYGQVMVRHFQMVTEKAAQYGISVNAHEPVKDTGLRRTYPNFVTREGGRGTEYEAWGGPIGNPPSHTTVVPFTRGLSGPFDFTPGIFDILRGSRAGIDRVRTTLAKQLAHFVVVYSPLQMAADLPKNYLGHPAYEFIRHVPADWHTTRILNGEIGKYITTVRRDRNSGDWYLGSVTNEDARELEIKLGFLSSGKTYCADIYRDAEAAHWETNPSAYVIESKKVRAADKLVLRLAPGGGQAIRFSVCRGLN